MIIIDCLLSSKMLIDLFDFIVLKNWNCVSNMIL